jgi:hypothetical protein
LGIIILAYVLHEFHLEDTGGGDDPGIGAVFNIQ